VDDVPAAVDEPSIPSPTPTTQPPPLSQDIPSTSQVLPTLPPLIAQPPLPQQQSQPSQPSHDAKILMDLLHTLLETCTTLTRRVEHLEHDKIAQSLEITKLKQRVKKLERRNKLKVSKLRRLKKDVAVVAKDVDDIEKTVEIKENADRKPQTEAQARKNMMIYMRNMAGFKMEYFKGMKYDDTRPIFKKYFNSNVALLDKTKEQTKKKDNKALKRASESQAEKAAKKQKLDKEVPVVDYAIHTENNKPYFKIIRADETYQLFLSFLSLLRNFDREDLEVLWELVKERFASSKPKNFLDDFLLTTLTYIFENPNVEA
nr:hypothetical protein [Tanacetum cinerariifolium]